MFNYVVLTVHNIDKVMDKTGKSHAYLVKALIEFNAIGVYPVKIPLPIKPIWATI